MKGGDKERAVAGTPHWMIDFQLSELFEAKNFGLRTRGASVCELPLKPLRRNGFKTGL